MDEYFRQEQRYEPGQQKNKNTSADACDTSTTSNFAKETTFWVGDCEAFTVDDAGVNLPKHDFFLGCIGKLRRGDNTIHRCATIDKLLDKMGNEDVCYFHNLSYDAQFIMSNVHAKITELIRVGTKIISLAVIWRGRNLHFRDSYSLLTMPLRDLPKAFLTAEQRHLIRKEEFPYNYYARERYEYNQGDVEIAALYCKNPREFREAVTAFTRPGGQVFNMQDFAGFYCRQDTCVLKEALLSLDRMTCE